MSEGIKRTYLFTKMVSAKSDQDFKDLTNEIVVELQETQQLKATNKELLSALESMANLFPERPVKDGSGGIGWSDHVGKVYDQAQSAITNAKQMGDSDG